MREIKFRMWNNAGESSRMFYSDNSRQTMACLVQQMEHSWGSLFGYNHEANGNAFMQFTGLKDKNGKEIYEGDIVRNRQGGWNVVVYKDCGFEATVSADQSSLYTKEWWDETMVIGNIYENPELLSASPARNCQKRRGGNNHA